MTEIRGKIKLGVVWVCVFTLKSSCRRPLEVPKEYYNLIDLIPARPCEKRMINSKAAHQVTLETPKLEKRQ